VFPGSKNYVSFRDLHIHNTGTADILQAGTFGFAVIGCELDETTGDAIQATTQVALVVGNHIHNVGSMGVRFGFGLISGNFFQNDGSNDFDRAVYLDNNAALGEVSFNIFSLDGASIGIELSGYSYFVHDNSILSAGGTGTGITSLGTASVHGGAWNNLVEGFSGAGGVGIAVPSNNDLVLYGRNAVFNCTTAYSLGGDVFHNLGDNETLGSSPFAKSGADTFANRAVYFAPVNTGNVRGGAYPTELRLDKGAVQHADPAATVPFLAPIILPQEVFVRRLPYGS
jgi:hypothetical protein